MAMLCKGVYADTGEKAFEAETCYYLLFQIHSICICIAHLKSERKCIDFSEWENECGYYHFYCDHLLFSLGQISNRLVITDKTKERYKKRIKENRRNLNFDDELYPIISEKNTRNTVEHIDEYDIDEVLQAGGVGGFNVIFDDLEDSIKDRIRMSKDEHPYYFDTIEQKIVIHRHGEMLTIKLEELSDELSGLKGAINSLQSFLEC